MPNAKKRKFNWRSFTSLYLTWTGLIIVVSGLILYIAPPGRIANWTRIPILGLEKYQWQALHTIFTFLLVIAAGFHIWYNWKPLIAYLRTRIQQKIKLRKEMWASVLVTLLLIVLILLRVPPFTTVINFGESVKDGWTTTQNNPPVPHAEDMSLDKLSELLNKQPSDLLTALKTHGIEAEKDQLVKEIADQNNTTPSELFEKMKLRKQSSSQQKLQGKGYGRMTLEELCPQLEVDIEEALQRLQEAGIMAQKNVTIKNIASSQNIKPVDLVNIIKGVESMSGEHY